MNSSSFALLTTASIVLASSLAHAGFTAAVTPPFRGAPCTGYAGWEVFTVASGGPNAPDDASTTADGATLTQLVPGAIITSTGNIYHPLEQTVFRVDHVAAADVQEVVLQTATLGNARDHGSFTLTYRDAGGSDVVLAPDELTPLVQIPQQREELYLRWDLASVPEDVRAFRLEWHAAAPNTSFDATLLDVRTECQPGAPACFGDGSGEACPCGNVGATGHGCGNSVHAAGALLEASGRASLSGDTLVLSASSMPNATALFFQGERSPLNGIGTPFGDGLLCAEGTLVRLGTSLGSGGASSYPGGAQAPISVRGAVALPGTARTYQAWYRNAAPLFCTSATFNATNGYDVVWQP